MKVWAFLLVLVASFGLLTACSSDSNDNGILDNNVPSSEDRATAMAGNEGAANDERQEFEAEARDALDDIDRELTDAKNQLEDSSADEREALERRIDGLEDEREELGNKIDELRDSEDWKKARDELDKSLDKLRSDLDSVIDDLRN
jgi:DNA repair exonuclease SbcCD ATPase subunit